MFTPFYYWHTPNVYKVIVLYNCLCHLQHTRTEHVHSLTLIYYDISVLYDIVLLIVCIQFVGPVTSQDNTFM